MTGSLSGREDYEQTSAESKRTFALIQGLIEQNTQSSRPGYPAEIHIK